MTDRSTGPACGNNPNFRMTDGDRKAVDDFKARLALQASAKPYIDSAVWVDGDPLMEVIAATVWQHCARDSEDMPQLVCDDPRTIAAFAAAVARAHAAVSVSAAAPPTDRAALRDRIRLAIARQYLDAVGSERTVDDLDDWEFGSFVDAVLAVLPPPADRAAEQRDDIQVWPLDRILSEVRCGSQDWTWEEEWADLDRRHAETGYLVKLEQEIRENGITMPVLIGSDGRLWDGHHRLRVAVRLRIGYVPVEITPSRLAAETAGHETQAAHPPVTEWRTETQRRGDHWSPWCGGRYELDEARADFAETVANDQGRHSWRLIRATTTYTVEAEHQPAAAPAAVQTEEA